MVSRCSMLWVPSNIWMLECCRCLSIVWFCNLSISTYPYALVLMFEHWRYPVIFYLVTSKWVSTLLSRPPFFFIPVASCIFSIINPSWLDSIRCCINSLEFHRLGLKLYLNSCSSEFGLYLLLCEDSSLIIRMWLPCLDTRLWMLVTWSLMGAWSS